MVKSIIKKGKKDSKVIKKEESKKVMKPRVNTDSHKVVEKSKTTPKEPKPSEVKPIKHSKLKTKKPVEQKIEKPVEQKNDKPTEEIHTLKQLEEKILEKFEENKPEVEEMLNQKSLDPIEHKEEVQVKIEDKKNVEKAEKKDINKTKVIDDNDNRSRVEAILFAVGKYLEDEQIAQLCDIDKRQVKKALEELKQDYDARNNALMVVQEGSSWKINVREKYLSLVRKVVADTELSKSIMETLAVIAWKTPVYQNEIVRIRGNKCYDHIEELVNSGFVTKDKKGRSYVLKTTEKFYNYFDIDHKNLHGVMSEAKMPTEQKTLDEIDKPVETPYSREKLLHALETIETKSIVQTEEDKLSQKKFLEEIHKKIDDASKRTDDVVAEIPKPMHETIQPEPVAEEAPAPLQGVAITENEDEIVINTDSANGEHHFQKPEEQPQKIKQLTKKQLEKKFKEELQRVKDKSELKK